MKALQWFIVLGLLCFGLSSDDYLLAGFYGLAGLAAIFLGRRRPWRITPALESGIIIAGCAFGYWMGTLPGQSTHFAIGHGLAWVQIVRLLRVLNAREKKFSLLIALFHVGVACTVVLDVRFTLILPAVIILLPRVLRELEADQFDSPNLPRLPRFHPAWYLVIAAVMIVFFITLPRGLIRTPLRVSRSGSTDTGSLADAVLDPTRSASALAGRVLMQIEGEHIGYLRCFSLTETDGVQWFPAARPPLKPLEFHTPAELAHYPSRRVRVKDPAFLGRVFPVDGQVVFLNGNFFQGPVRNAHGGIQCLNMWNTVNNIYEYWIEPKPRIETLFRGQLRGYTNHPPQSARLEAWVKDRLRGENDPYQQARRLEAWFHHNYTYRLGAPALNRLNPVEDFIFNHREGHCERFAAALAMTLRMAGIPARVVVGYAPSSRDWFSGWINVRFRDAHAWTEAWFADRGWVQLDATPAASSAAPSWSLADMFEDLDFAWYAQIANFDRPTQRQLLADIVQALARLPGWLTANAGWIALLLSPLLLFAIRFLVRRQMAKKGALPRPRRDSLRVVGHYYGQMLLALARQGFHRGPAQTPLEFLGHLEQQSLSILNDVRMITDLFCATRYGGLLVTPALKDQIESALARIRGAKSAGG